MGGGSERFGAESGPLQKALGQGPPKDCGKMAREEAVSVLQPRDKVAWAGVRW